MTQRPTPETTGKVAGGGRRSISGSLRVVHGDPKVLSRLPREDVDQYLSAAETEPQLRHLYPNEQV